MNSAKDCDLRSICTVSQMAQKLGLSRARLYQLINSGVFPPPAYCRQSKKPVYPHRLQEICLEIRKTGIGLHGQVNRFNRRRINKKHKREHKQITAILRKMGLSVSTSHVRRALRQLGLPTAGKAATDGETIRKLFQHFYSERQKSV